MEVFAVLTPTYSGNSKAFLEAWWDEIARHASAPASYGRITMVLGADMASIWLSSWPLATVTEQLPAASAVRAPAGVTEQTCGVEVE